MSITLFFSPNSLNLMTFLEFYFSANIVCCWCDDVSMIPLAFYILLLIGAETGIN